MRRTRADALYRAMNRFDAAIPVPWPNTGTRCSHVHWQNEPANACCHRITTLMLCREHCGACCVAPSITVALPGMPQGKPAGVRCVNLDPITLRCRIWGTAEYPETCRRFAPAPDVCGNSPSEALTLITALEQRTS